MNDINKMSNKSEKIVVIALGGNALQVDGKPATAEEQLKTVCEMSPHLINVLDSGYKLLIVHGNGPQVGRIVLQNEHSNSITPAMPFDVCGAMSQGMIGYHIGQALHNECAIQNKNYHVATVLTQVVVDKKDSAFANPTKPIGPFYSKEESEAIAKEKGYTFVEDSGRGYRRVVASPKPVRIVELDTIKTLLANNNIVIACGGGGIPVLETLVNNSNKLEGVPAVIDKDLAAMCIASNLNAEMLVILTAVEKVAINFGKPNQSNLDSLTIAEARKHMADGQFPAGSMLPKVEACIAFVENQKGGKAIIASLEKVKDALAGKNGTVISA